MTQRPRTGYHLQGHKNKAGCCDFACRDIAFQLNENHIFVILAMLIRQSV